LFETCETTHPQHQRPATTRGELWSTPLLPQSFDSDTEISVVSTTYFDYLPFFSNFGTHVDRPPASGILFPFPGRTLYVADGTSMAARQSAASPRCCSRAWRFKGVTGLTPALPGSRSASTS